MQLPTCTKLISAAFCFAPAETAAWDAKAGRTPTALFPNSKRVRKYLMADGKVMVFIGSIALRNA
jgi:hypothetical protein